MIANWCIERFVLRIESNVYYCYCLCYLSGYPLGASFWQAPYSGAAQSQYVDSSVRVFLVLLTTKTLHISAQTKLEHITGIPIANQRISLLNAEDESTPVAILSDESKPLGFYGLTDFQTLQVRLFVFFSCKDINPNVFVVVVGGRYEPFNVFHRTVNWCLSSG